MNPKYPIYIVSKGRWKKALRLTSRVLEELAVPYHIIVEAQEFKQYNWAIDADKILILPERYQAEYDVFWKDDDPRTGPGPARNFAWDHAIENGHARHWVLDDNLQKFFRFNRNLKVPVASGTIFRAAEDFVDRYENVAIAGFQYEMFCPRRTKCPPYKLNTRIYSNLLIKNDIPYRWRGRYNEDTDLSIRALKDGLCTVQFNAFLANKVWTQQMTGGNTDVFYSEEGTLKKSQMLADMHPDVTQVVWRYSRWHHYVDYDVFKGNKLQKKPGVVIPEGVNEYGMRLAIMDAGNQQPQPKVKVGGGIYAV